LGGRHRALCHFSGADTTLVGTAFLPKKPVEASAEEMGVGKLVKERGSGMV